MTYTDNRRPVEEPNGGQSRAAATTGFSMTYLSEAALAYAAYGWPVFPCAPSSKIPITAHGVKDATTDALQIAKWWARVPAANIGIACGAPGPDVLDVDVKNGAPGRESLRQLALAGVIRGAFAEVGTPSGGLHYYYLGTDQRNAVRARAGIDFRSQGGYVLAPPSQVNGAGYVLLDIDLARVGVLDWSRVAQFLAPAPLSLPPLRTHTRTTPLRLGGVFRRLGDAVEGERNALLFWAACRLVEGDASSADFAELTTVARTIGLDDFEIERTIASARRAANHGS